MARPKGASTKNYKYEVTFTIDNLKMKTLYKTMKDIVNDTGLNRGVIYRIYKGHYKEKYNYMVIKAI